MKKINMACGHIAFEATALDTTFLGGRGICDDCGKFALRGYLVPVLNHYQCPACYEQFASVAKYYPEDRPYEDQVAAYYVSKIPHDPFAV